MSNVPDYWRNQYTTLDAKRAKVVELRPCDKCGQSIAARAGSKKKYCLPCSDERQLERKRRKRAAHRKPLKTTRADRPVRKPNPMRGKTPHDDLAGLSVHHLTILDRAIGPIRNINYWRVNCACGKQFITSGSSLVFNKVHHCGCMEAGA